MALAATCHSTFSTRPGRSLPNKYLGDTWGPIHDNHVHWSGILKTLDAKDVDAVLLNIFEAFFDAGAFLTQVGELFLRQIQQVLAVLDEATQRMPGRRAGRVFSVNVPTTFASLWMLSWPGPPALPRHPHRHSYRCVALRPQLAKYLDWWFRQTVLKPPRGILSMTFDTIRLAMDAVSQGLRIALARKPSSTKRLRPAAWSKSGRRYKG